MSSFGEAYRVTVFGSSHGPSVGVTVEGIPAGFQPDLNTLQEFLDRRAPGRSPLASARREEDHPTFTAGLANGIATGGPLTAEIPNQDAKPEAYEDLKYIPRPGHADYPAMVKLGDAYGTGGGAFSGRMTAPLCIAGGLAMQLLALRGITISARAVAVGGETDETRFDNVIAAAKAEGDSVGGVIECTVTGLPVGLGGAMWDGLESRIAAAVYGIPAVKGVEFGDGFAAAALRGSENNDEYYVNCGAIETHTNHAGGILGGMADGAPLVFRAAIKPTPSIAKPQHSVELRSGVETELRISGRHDSCIVPRAVPCVEAAAACAVLDVLLLEERGADLSALRQEIDRADRALLRAFDARMDVAARIGAWKKARGMAVLDRSREAAKLDAVAAQSEYPDAARSLYETLMRLSREEQEKL